MSATAISKLRRVRRYRKIRIFRNGKAQAHDDQWWWEAVRSFSTVILVEGLFAASDFLIRACFSFATMLAVVSASQPSVAATLAVDPGDGGFQNAIKGGHHNRMGIHLASCSNPRSRWCLGAAVISRRCCPVPNPRSLRRSA
jgi:hypothetical protein